MLRLAKPIKRHSTKIVVGTTKPSGLSSPLVVGWRRAHRTTAVSTPAVATAAPTPSASSCPGENRRWDRPRARASAMISARSCFHHDCAFRLSRKASAVSGTTPFTASPATRSKTRCSYRFRPAGSRCTMWIVVWKGSSEGCRNSTNRRAPRSARVASAASSVRSHPLPTMLANAGVSGPRSWVAGLGATRAGRVANNINPYRPNQAARDAAAMPTSIIHGRMDTSSTWTETPVHFAGTSPESAAAAA